MVPGEDDEDTGGRVIEWSRGERDGPRLNPRAQASIGAGLRAMYEELRDQPLPDRLLDLIAKLDQKVADGTHEG